MYEKRKTSLNIKYLLIDHWFIFLCHLELLNFHLVSQSRTVLAPVRLLAPGKLKVNMDT